MGTPSARDAIVWDPGAIIGTMALGVLVGVVSSVVLTAAAHVFGAIANPEVAAPSLGLELYFATLFGLLFGVAAAVGAAVTLAVVDHRLAASRVKQGCVAGVGAALAGLAVSAYLGPMVVVSGGGLVGVLALMAAATFGLMVVRAGTHTVVGS